MNPAHEYCNSSSRRSLSNQIVNNGKCNINAEGKDMNWI